MSGGLGVELCSPTVGGVFDAVNSVRLGRLQKVCWEGDTGSGFTWQAHDFVGITLRRMFFSWQGQWIREVVDVLRSFFVVGTFAACGWICDRCVLRGRCHEFVMVWIGRVVYSIFHARVATT